MALILIASGLFIYSIATAFNKKLSKGFHLKTTRKIWYALCLLSYAVYIFNSGPQNLISIKFLKPNMLWDYLVLLIIFIAAAVLVDTLILRTATLGSLWFGGLGGKIEEDEIKSQASDSMATIEMINNKIEAENNVIQNMNNIIKPIEDKFIEGLEIDWIEETENLIKLYCDSLKYPDTVTVYDADDETIDNLINHYKLTKSARKALKQNIQEDEALFCNREDDTINYIQDVYFIPVNLYFYGKVIIALKGKNCVIVEEKYILENLVRIFDLQLLNTFNKIMIDNPTIELI